MQSIKFKQLTVALCMALVPVSVYAAGLGKLNVNSALGEPLKAEIELLSVTPEELTSIVAAVAPEAAYAAQGLERPASHATIRVDVTKNANGNPVLKLHSSQPITDPYLDMLLQVDWTSGRLLREYTVLLDPPGYTGESSAAAVQSPVSNASTSKSSASGSSVGANPVSDEVKPKRGKRSRAKRQAAAPAEGGQEYTIERGDTLNKVARQMAPEGVSLDQMLIALYQTNPDAFINHNINQLKTGKILRAPSQETLNSISAQDAAKEVKVQAADWNAYRNKLAGIVADAPAAPDAEASSQASSGKIKSAEDKSAPATGGAKDTVKLSAGEAKGGKNAKDMEAKIAALQEEVTAREKGLQEAQSRTADLEKQVADLQKLLAMKNSAMAEAQKQATEAAAQKPAQTPSAAEAKPEVKPAEPKPAEAKPEEAKPVEPKPAEVKPEPSAPAPATAETPAPAPTPAATPAPAPAVAQPAPPKPAPVPAPEPTPEPSLMDGLMGSVDLSLVGGGLGLLGLLGGGWAYLRNKRKKSLADFEQGIMTSGGLKANTVFGNTQGASVDTGDTSFLTDFSQSASGSMIDTHDVDPIAEAEVYMAYGREAQAEEILKDAIVKEPKRYELHLKLLEMYAGSSNMSAFETVAGELYTSLGAEDPTWAKVAAMGAQLEPNNPLYQAGAVPTGAGVAASLGDGGDKLGASDFADSPLASEADLDFNMDNDGLIKKAAPVETIAADAVAAAPALAATMDFEMPSAVEPSKELDAGLDFDMGDFGKSPTDEAMEALSAADFAQTEPSSFDMSLDMGDTVPETAAMSFEATAPLSEEMPSFDLGVPEFTSETTLANNALGGDTLEASVFMPTIPEVQVDEPVEQAISMSDFSFDLDPTPDSAAEFIVEDTATMPEVPDLSGISFDMPEVVADTEPSLEIASGYEPDDVNTKLDLVTAYLDMDDKVGAKELLGEVLKEGGPNQKKRAEELLKTIG